MLKVTHIAAAATIAALAGTAPGGALSQDPMFQMGQLTFLEAVTHVTRDLHDYGLEIDGPFTFNADITPSGFNGSLNGSFGGQALSLHYNGTTTGGIGQNSNVNFSASGSLGDHSFNLTGNTDWHWDAGAGDWVYMDYAEDSNADGPVRTGAPSRTVRAVELVAGAAVGGWFGGLVGALTGAGGAWTISNYAVALTKAPATPPPVITPPPPTYPTSTTPPTGPNKINIKVESGGTVNIINGNSGNIIINGNQINNTVTGSGIPAPGALAGLPMIGLWGCRRRRPAAVPA